ncbi:cytochrome c [Stappia sp. ES.058]|uniref:c-type cytochrome n=1 Tax=Stappia sp. ES.058 TaxID=1881061 RepID=UPI00087B78B5|nr:cytochrome c [Stappia sp. ES.058]SDU02505.1 Cytochrome c2 [Stappia sp. ES.058]
MTVRSVVFLGSAALVAVIGAVIFFAGNDERAATGPGELLASVTVPPLSGPAAAGEELFAKTCATCHGVNAAGRAGQGPPLVHVIYEPGHHADGAFYLAVAQGVRQHHWTFGNMPAVAGVSSEDISRIVAYVRTLQRANGIR